ncbi:P-type DNA transfer protein VirB5 [Aminobacter sp. MSH1]|uniref:P-type DNA transfer protein VirB5 n=1 Tax=Aminobacter sp. MSH1 TaxID=374606 RepID=UPI000D335F0A|nr:P-type DNA transfer protein VirB5 [Aminobacter sp. MSH1]
MKMMKRLLVTCAFALVTVSAQAQIPVTDAALNTQTKLGQIETIKKWVEQYKQMEAQITQLEQQYKAVTGTRNLGQVFNNPELKDYLPKEWQSVYDSVRNGGSQGLTGRGAQVYQQSKIYDACKAIVSAESKRTCEAMAVKGAQDKGNVLDAFDAAKKRLAQINQLMGTISSTTDPKAIAELQARIATEQAAIANSQTEMQLYAMVSAAEDKVLEQQRREINAKANARKGIAPLQPATF